MAFKSTDEIKVPDKLVDQVIGQDEAVYIIKKAASQRRHVLLIGDPGTGKSLLGMALAEMLPKSQLKDILALPNNSDENNPLIKVVEAGKGREETQRSVMDASGWARNQNILFFALAILAMLAPWWVREKYNSDIMFAAFFLGGLVFLVGVVIFINFNRRMKMTGEAVIPKVIVDNTNQKQAPFYDATGSHAGALLGDVLHDPFQTFFTTSELNVKTENGFERKRIDKQVDALMKMHSKNILRKEKNNYEAIFLPKNELFVLGEINGSISPVEVLSSNKYDYGGKMIKLTTSENKEIVVTPEHKIAVWQNGKRSYLKAKNINEGAVVAQAEDIIIDEQDVINTYSKEQQKLAESYYTYLELRKQNPTWGYKRIATKLGVSYGRTRWWENNSSPVPVQTVEWLKSKGLVPLKIDDSRLPSIAKVLGATYGDGGIFENLNGIFLSSSEKEAVEEFGKDLERIFGLNDNENSRILEGGVYGHSWCYQNTNRNSIRFFLALGAPRGNKTKLELKTPSWIKLSKNLEEEFYGSFLGGELGTPIIHKRGSYLTTLEVGITGAPQFKNNRISFLKELAEYFERNKINTTSIYEGKTKTEAILFRLLVAKKFDNVMNFMTGIKINYCKYKIERLYKALGQWSLLKKNKYNELIRRGYGAEHAMKVLNLTPDSLYLLLNHFGPKEALP